MTTASDLVNETLSFLHATHRDPLNKLNGSLDNSQTTVTLTYDMGAIQTAALISVDLELMYVWSVSGQVATVQRGFGGTTAAAHSDGSLVTVNPKFSAFHVLDAINTDLNDLSANGLFQVKEVTVTYSPAVMGYNLTSVTDTVLEILEVNWDDPGPNKEWPRIDSFKLRRSSDTSDFASGLALVVYEAGQPGRPMRIKYSCPFGTFSALSDNVTTTGLPATAYDIPPIGAAMRLQSYREGQRNFNEAQGAPRRAGEVPPGSQLVAARALKEMRRDRIRVESSRLRKQWPAKRRVLA